jgi:hypothetical protein
LRNVTSCKSTSPPHGCLQTHSVQLQWVGVFSSMLMPLVIFVNEMLTLSSLGSILFCVRTMSYACFSSRREPREIKYIISLVLLGSVTQYLDTDRQIAVSCWLLCPRSMMQGICGAQFTGRVAFMFKQLYVIISTFKGWGNFFINALGIHTNGCKQHATGNVFCIQLCTQCS